MPCNFICCLRDAFCSPSDNEQEVFSQMTSMMNNVIDEQLVNGDKEAESRIKIRVQEATTQFSTAIAFAASPHLAQPPMSAEESRLAAEVAQLQARERILKLQAEKQRLTGVLNVAS